MTESEFIFKSLSNKELEDLINAIQQEKKLRDMRAKELAWKNVREAISAYVKDFGPIEINADCSSDINSDTNLTNIGHIELDYY